MKKNFNNTNVLLTYGWVRSSYAILRNLSQHGISVYVSDSGRLGMSQFSKFSKGYDKYHSMHDNKHEFIKDIIKISKKRNINLIFPSHDETELLAKNKKLFSNETSVLFPSYSTCKKFNNKSMAYDLAASLGISVPDRIVYNKPEDLVQLITEKGYKKLIIKLLKGNSSKGVYYADTPKEAMNIVKSLIEKFELNKKRYPQVEEYVYGEGWGHSVLYWKGELVAEFTHQRLREKILTGGTSTMRKSAKKEKISKAALKIFDKVKWHGLAMAEFKVCKETGKYWFIEINPRAWGSIPLAINCGVEFPYLAYLCATRGVKEAKVYNSNAKIKKSWKYKWVLGTVFLSFTYLFKGQFKLALQILFEKADGYDDFYKDDKFVFLGQILRYAKNSIYKKSLNPIEKGMVG